MTLAALLNQSLTIQARGATGTDDYNNEITGTTATAVVNGYVEQTDAEEVTVDRETYRTNWRVFLPAGTVIDGSDRIVYGSRTFEVIGTPHAVWNPRARLVHHIEVRAREVTG